VAAPLYARDVAGVALESWRPSMEQWRQMVELGVFGDERVELLDGVITPMTPKGPPHEDAIAFLTRAVLESVDRDYTVRVQSALSLAPGWEPEPDLALVRPGTPKPWHPAAPDWVCEVADSSLARDRGIKRAAYARFGIPEYWLVELPERRVVVHTEPAQNGYEREVAATHGTVSSATVAGLTVDLAALWVATFSAG
jgi:Uma2 family endonuclease